VITFATASRLPWSSIGVLVYVGVAGTPLFSAIRTIGDDMDDQLDGQFAAKRRRHNSKAYLSGLGLATMMISPASAAQVTPASVNGWQHFVDCFGVMLHDSNAHAANCDPGQAGPNSSLTSFPAALCR
jgi:hypothetical protein